MLLFLFTFIIRNVIYECKIKSYKEGGSHVIKNVVNEYKEYTFMLNKQMKYIDKNYKKNDTFFNKLYKIYKFKSSSKKWGNVIKRPSLDNKFNNNVMDILNKIGKNSSVMDYGCGDGWTLEYFKYNDVKDIKCVDIDDYRSNVKNSTFIKNLHLSSLDSKIDDDSLDLVMALQSLHHVEFENDKTDFYKRINLIVKSIVSKIKYGGYLLIREHDVKNTNDLYPVLFEHLLYELMELKDKSMSFDEVRKWISDYHNNHKGWYFSKEFMHKILEDNGMKLLDTEYKIGLNPSHIYNSIYLKTNK
jgi:SAM-dependent methyltransferase